ncbi:MAG TPA: DNA alkylation repair protein [Candidatus Acidoferrales bacterium]|nr:DNA alkylation repair protein [Candidatus Acidoferrales bacterium]
MKHSEPKETANRPETSPSADKSRRDAMKIIRTLEEFRNPENVAGMARFGISSQNTLGVPMPVLRDLAKEVCRDPLLNDNNHGLALELWKTGVHEARILAGLIDDSELVTEPQMETWAGDFDSWDVCDQVCSNLFDRTAFAIKKADRWAKREEEFVKRAGFVLMAALAVHDKSGDDKVFLNFLPIIKREATDERNFVRKAVNWALRGIGKRNKILNKAAVKTAKEIQRMDSKTAKWIASDALRELTSTAVLKRLTKVKSKKSKVKKT